MNNEIEFGTKYHLSSDGYSFEYISDNNSISVVLYKDDKTVDVIPAGNRTLHNIINYFESKITLGHY